MKKNRLEIDYSYDFELLGLTTTAKSYRLAWELNKALGIHLTRKSDLCIHIRTAEVTYSFHEHLSPVTTLRLFKNRPIEAEFVKLLLVPESPQSDFILMIQGEDDLSKRLHQQLRNIPSVELVAFIPLPPLKSKDNFIF